MRRFLPFTLSNLGFLEMYLGNPRGAEPYFGRALELQNLTHSPERRWRRLYSVNAIEGALRRVDFYEERRDMRGSLRLRGRF